MHCTWERHKHGHRHGHRQGHGCRHSQQRRTRTRKWSRTQARSTWTMDMGTRNQWIWKWTWSSTWTNTDKGMNMGMVPDMETDLDMIMDMGRKRLDNLNWHHTKLRVLEGRTPARTRAFRPAAATFWPAGGPAFLHRDHSQLHPSGCYAHRPTFLLIMPANDRHSAIIIRVEDGLLFEIEKLFWRATARQIYGSIHLQS